MEDAHRLLEQNIIARLSEAAVIIIKLQIKEENNTNKLNQNISQRGINTYLVVSSVKIKRIQEITVMFARFDLPGQRQRRT